MNALTGMEGVSRNTSDAHANSDLSAMVGRRFGDDGEEIVYYSDADGAIVVPAAPNQGDARLELHAVLDDGSLLAQYRARNPDTDEFQYYTYRWSPAGGWTDLTEVFAAARIGRASPGAAVGEPVRSSFDDPRDRLYRWTPAGGREEILLPDGLEAPSIPFAINEAGTVFFVRLQGKLYRWKADSGFMQVRNDTVFEGWSLGATTTNGALAALEKNFWDAARGEVVLKDELLAQGADPAVFASGDIDAITDVEVVNGETLFFGRFRTFDFQTTHFLAALPYEPAEAETAWYSDASEIADGWRRFDWFKGFKPQPESDWIFHGRHGWLFVKAEDTSRMFLWDGALGRWMFTSASVYPWMYAYGSNEGWVFFFEGGSPGSRFFKRGDTGQVLSEQDLRVD